MAEIFKPKFFLLTLFLSVSLIFFPSVEAKIRRYKWEVKYEFKSPDCYRKLVITTNGRTPGPSIVAERGDTIIVELKNSLLTENVAIHWHGIRQVTLPFPFPTPFPLVGSVPRADIVNNGVMYDCENIGYNF